MQSWNAMASLQKRLIVALTTRISNSEWWRTGANQRESVLPRTAPTIPINKSMLFKRLLNMATVAATGRIPRLNIIADGCSQQCYRNSRFFSQSECHWAVLSITSEPQFSVTSFTMKLLGRKKCDEKRGAASKKQNQGATAIAFWTSNFRESSVETCYRIRRKKLGR